MCLICKTHTHYSFMDAKRNSQDRYEYMIIYQSPKSEDDDPANPIIIYFRCELQLLNVAATDMQ